MLMEIIYFYVSCRAAKSGANQGCNERDSMKRIRLKTNLHASRISLVRHRASVGMNM